MKFFEKNITDSIFDLVQRYIRSYEIMGMDASNMKRLLKSLHDVKNKDVKPAQVEADLQKLLAIVVLVELS